MKGSEYFRIPNRPGFCIYKAMNMPEYGWIMPKWTVMNMAGFWICLAKVYKVLNIPTFLNMLGFEIWQGCEYGWFIQGSKYVWIRLNIP